MPMTSKMAVSSGMAIRLAMMRGETKNLIGLIAMESSASICSVARMVPSSAAMAEPVLPVTMKADSTGPNSRNRLRAAAEPR